MKYVHFLFIFLVLILSSCQFNKSNGTTDTKPIQIELTEEQKIDSMKTEFVSLASHQLRTPLTSINWYAELMNDEAKLTKTQK